MSIKETKTNTFETWCLLGASRGLGAEFARRSARMHGSGLALHLSARKAERLKALEAELSPLLHAVESAVWDFAKTEESEEILTRLESLRPDRIFYFAGGGPYGNFDNKEWKDHQWAYNLSLLFPSRLLHASLAWPWVKQWVFVGSSIAEEKADPLAASYSSAKHGLLGLIKSLHVESQKDVRVISPGYMDTEMLPLNAKARQLGVLWSTEQIADELLTWIERPRTNFHLKFTAFASDAKSI